MRDYLSARITLWANRLLGTILLALTVAMPPILRWYANLRPLGQAPHLAILIAFYCCVPAVFAALWDVDHIMRRILTGEVFVLPNVQSIRRIRWYCAAVCMICFPAAFFYPPLVFMVVIMAFLSLIVSVLGSVLKAAVTIREENDLTI